MAEDAHLHAVRQFEPVLLEQRGEVALHRCEQRHVEHGSTLVVTLDEREVGVRSAVTQSVDLAAHPDPVEEPSPELVVDRVGELGHRVRRGWPDRRGDRPPKSKGGVGSPARFCPIVSPWDQPPLPTAAPAATMCACNGCSTSCARWRGSCSGWCRSASAAIGIIVPGLPTTVFFIIAAACFAKSSPRLERWVLDLPRIGPAVERYRDGNGMPQRAKYWAIGMIVVFTTISIIVVDIVAFRLGIAVVAAIGVWYVGWRVAHHATRAARRALTPAAQAPSRRDVRWRDVDRVVARPVIGLTQLAEELTIDRQVALATHRVRSAGAGARADGDACRSRCRNWRSSCWKRRWSLSSSSVYFCHSVPNLPISDRIWSLVCSMTKLSYAWRMTPRKANRVSGEHITTRWFIASSISAGSASWMKPVSCSLGRNNST